MALAKELGKVELKIVPPNFPLYKHLSDQVRCILERYDANFEPMGLDESYLDFTAEFQNTSFS